MDLKQKYILRGRQGYYMSELKEIVDRVFECDICVMKRFNNDVEARMVFSKIMREIGCSYPAIGRFFGISHANIIRYIVNFDTYFKDEELNKKYHKCRDTFFNYHPIEKIYEERDELKALQEKYARFQDILDIMESRTPVGKEKVLEEMVKLFLNGL